MHQSSVTRRSFIASTAAALASPLLASPFQNPTTPIGIPLNQEPLPFALQALEPYMKANTLRRHYYEHHAAQQRQLQETLEKEEMTVGNVVSLMPGMERMIQPQRTESKMPIGRLFDLGLSSEPPGILCKESIQSIRRHGGGHINHTIFWRFLCPPNSGPSGPQGRVARAIQEDFGSVKTFRQYFKEKAMAHQGPGWAWLVYRPDGCLVVSTTRNEDNPLMQDHVLWQEAGRPILPLDLWEHSYAEQYGEDREQYIDAWWKLVNWNFVSRAYSIVTGLV